MSLVPVTMSCYKPERLKLIITRGYYQKNKELLEDLAKTDERTRKAIEFLKTYKSLQK